MGLLVDGKWHDRWYDTHESGGRFVRSSSQFRNWITPDGSAGPTGSGGFRAEPGRYHLYVSHACPWAHRTMIFRALKGLKSAVGVSVVHPFMGEEGWTFNSDFPGATGDPVNGAKRLYEIYLKVDPSYTGRVTTPTLWDKQTGSIVSNESADIVRMFNSAFEGVSAADTDFYPPDLRGEIDEINARVYDSVNNGVYKAGFATTQEAYEEAYKALFRTLRDLEQRLSTSRYLVGNRQTEADWRLFTTLVRFDPVYHGHFKCNKRRLKGFHNLWNYTLDLFQTPGIAETVHLDHIKHHYYASHKTINPTGIVPLGPKLNYNAPHDRDRLA